MNVQRTEDHAVTVTINRGAVQLAKLITGLVVIGVPFAAALYLGIARTLDAYGASGHF